MDISVLDHEKVLSMLPDRPNDSHKGSFGKILLLCGSRGFTGAAAFAAMGHSVPAQDWYTWPYRKAFMK